uniref:DNA/RNA-binding protein Alba-like domain-containing protein n=1 Tax=Aegilops tauschii subsp. strangulata TaxID=200361 RepID=A0A453HBV9_AEGTS
MDRYQRVERPRPESAIAENEIRITAQGLIRNYVSYATSLLQDRKIKEIVLKAMGQAISKSVAVTEIIKKRVPGLYQDTNISSVSITDVWEPIEEGLVPLEMTRHVSMISITLSPVDLDQNSPGYQSPAYVDQPRQQQRLQQAPAPLRQPRQQPSDYDGGRGRGRGRGRGWGRGGYGGYGNNQGGYNQGGYNQGGYNQGGYNQDGGYYDNQGGYNQDGGYYDNQGGYGGGYGYNQGRQGNYQENGGYNRGRGGMRGRGNWSYRGA